VRSILHNKPLRSLLSNLVGKGMPERIRSIGFACLGLTAAAGLAVVAVFAQMGFPLLAPAPLPGAPTAQNSVARAVRLGHDSPVAAIALAQSAPASPGGASSRSAFKAAPHGERGSGAVDITAIPVSTPPRGDSPGASEPSPAPAPEASPAPAPVPVVSEPAPAPVEVSVSSPGIGEKPSTSKPVTSKPDTPESEPSEPELEPQPSKPVKDDPEPEPPAPPKTKPPKPNKPEATPPPAPSYVPAPAPAPTDRGKEKEKKGK